jgi:putative transposase
MPKAARLARVGVELSREARRRLGWMEWYKAHGENARLTCRHFHISPDTFYRWWRRYDPYDLRSLEGRSQRPRRVRQPTWSPALVQAVWDLREQYPRWGKDKLVCLLREQGWTISTSMVGRIWTSLKQRGVLREPLALRVAAQRRTWRRQYAVRKPKDYGVTAPGDLVQLDTLDIRPLASEVFKQFTARDMVSRWDVVGLYRRATASNAADFLDQLLERMPFPVRAIQVDGGSEFHAAFEQACQAKGIKLFVLPPRSPKLNGQVERANRTHTEEFYELYDGELAVAPMNTALRAHERVYNHIRPHQALGYRTPAAYLAQSFPHLFPPTAPSPQTGDVKALVRQDASLAGRLARGGP